MEFNELIKHRHSVRKFLPNQVDSNVLAEIINDARTAPSWANAQERRVYIATQNVAKQIREEYVEQAKRGVIGVGDFSSIHREYWSKEAQNNMAEFGTRFEQILGTDSKEMLTVQDELFYAPALVFLTLPKVASTYSILDLGAFEMMIVLSTESRGLNSIVSYSLVKYPKIIRKYLSIPDDENLLIGIAIGYIDEDAKINQYRSNRTPLNQILTIKDTF